LKYIHFFRFVELQPNVLRLWSHPDLIFYCISTNMCPRCWLFVSVRGRKMFAVMFLMLIELFFESRSRRLSHLTNQSWQDYHPVLKLLLQFKLWILKFHSW